MNILITTSDCSQPALLGILSALKSGLKIIQIAGPIILIIALIVGFTKGTMNPEEKNFKKKIFNSVLALVIMFALPTLVDTVMNVLGENFTISECWQAIDKSNTNDGDVEYKDPYDYDENDKSKIVEESDYEKSN